MIDETESTMHRGGACGAAYAAESSFPPGTIYVLQEPAVLTIDSPIQNYSVAAEGVSWFEYRLRFSRR
jgi:hypothetical protein